MKRMYGLLEKQFEATMKKASRMKGRSGENLLLLLERRLDPALPAMKAVGGRQLRGHLQGEGPLGR